MVIALWGKGHITVTNKVARRLMREMGLKALYPKKNTSIRNQEQKVEPYLLKGLKIERPNQVWQVDITYVKIRGGFVFLICIMDVFSRKIMGWTLSTSLETVPCLEALRNALKNGTPEIVNSDQGCQFTSNNWIDLLVQEKIRISMTGKGRCHDNIFIERFWRSIKYEWIFLHGIDTVDQARELLSYFINYYNEKRPHQSLNYHTPSAIFSLGYIPTKEELRQQFKLQYQLRTEGVAMI